MSNINALGSTTAATYTTNTAAAASEETTDTTDTSTESTVKQAKKVLDKDDFLQLFITQLVHQNPMEPLSNDQFISQMAQFTAIEQATNTAQGITNLLAAQQENNELLAMLLSAQGNPVSMQMYEGASLIGLQVIAQSGDDAPYQGIVNRVTLSDGQVRIHMEDDTSFLLSEVIQISSPY